MSESWLVPVFEGPVPDVDVLDEAFRDAFRWGRVEDRYPGAMERSQARLGELGDAVLGAEVCRRVSIWLGDGPADDGTVLEALAGLHNEGDLRLGLPARQQCTNAGHIITANYAR